MSARIVLSPLALSDIAEIRSYVAENMGEAASRQAIEKIASKIDILGDFPMAGASLSSRLDIPTEYRYLVSGKSMVFYIVSKNIVRIIRVVDSRRDWARVLLSYEENSLS